MTKRPTPSDADLIAALTAAIPELQHRMTPWSKAVDELRRRLRTTTLKAEAWLQNLASTDNGPLTYAVVNDHGSVRAVRVLDRRGCLTDIPMPDVARMKIDRTGHRYTGLGTPDRYTLGYEYPQAVLTSVLNEWRNAAQQEHDAARAEREQEQHAGRDRFRDSHPNAAETIRALYSLAGISDFGHEHLTFRHHEATGHTVLSSALMDDDIDRLAEALRNLGVTPG